MSIWNGHRATGETLPDRTLDEDEARRALAVFAGHADGVHFQAAPHWRSRVAPGDDVEAMLAAVRALDAGQSVYVGLNPCPRDLVLGPGHRDVRKADVLRLVWLPVDCDPTKAEAGVKANATDAEKDAAHALARRVLDALESRGWPAPVVIDTGNGCLLAYRVELPNEPLSRSLLRSCLRALALEHDGDDGAHVDKSMHNPDRVVKLPGSWSCKGPDLPDRPHRRCRILHAPETLEAVPLELLKALAAPHRPPDPSSPTPLPWRLSGGAGTGQAYARAALERECGRMACTQKGDLNPQLNRSGFAMGQFVGSGHLTEDEVYNALLRAAVAAGCDDPAKDEDCLRRAIRAGKEQPRVIPERNGHAAKAAGPAKPPPDDGEPLTVCMADVEPLQVQWLVPGRIPLRFITVFAGRTGLGKSFVAHDLIARMTRGAEVPGGSPGECFTPGGALVISEDSPEYVLAPRFIEAGADMRRVRVMTWKAMANFNLGDAGMLARACAEVGSPRMVMIDPPTNFLNGADEHKNSEVRRVVMQVVEWVMTQDLGCLFITHVNKQTGKGIEAINRILGSVAWATTARIAHTFAPDPDDKSRCLFLPMKNNLGPLAKGLAYRIVGTAALARVEWLGEVETTADDAMAGEKGKPRRVVAAEWLVEMFRRRREWPSEELFAAARNEGVSRSAVFEAKAALDLPRARRNVGGDGEVTFVWWVPEDWPTLSPPGPAAPTGSDEVAL